MVRMALNSKKEDTPAAITSPTSRLDDACGVCGGLQFNELFYAADRLFLKEKEFRYVECRECGVVMINPLPSPELLAEIYTAQFNFPFHQVEFGKKSVKRRKKNVLRLERFVRKQQVRGISRFVELSSTSRILDAGSGMGTFLEAVRDIRGSRVFGMDVSFDACGYSKGKSKFPVVQGNLREAPFSARSFDLITMWHVLEHTGNPMEIIETSAALLKPGGILILEVPNYDNPVIRKLGKRWIGLFTPMHLYNFTRSSLTGMMEKAGFHIEKLEFRAAPPLFLLSRYFEKLSISRRGDAIRNLPVLSALLIPELPVALAYAMSGNGAGMTLYARKP